MTSFLEEIQKLVLWSFLTLNQINNESVVLELEVFQMTFGDLFFLSSNLVVRNSTLKVNKWSV
jgi:hypothetical protein